MKTLRAIVVLLVSIALPFSAMATMLENLHCHHDGLGVLLDASTTAQEHPCAHHAHHLAMAASQHHTGAAKVSDGGCDCAVKCHCQHHCTSGTAVAGVHATPVPPLYSRVPMPTPLMPAFVSDAQPSRLLRPPIAALPGAA